MGNAADSLELRLAADPARVLAAEGETSRITATLRDARNNPVSGKVIRFAASHGSITARDTTDVDGLAEALFRARSLNAEVTVRAFLGNEDSARATTLLALAGLEVEVTASAADVKVGDSAVVTIRVKDGAGKPVPFADLVIQGARHAAGRTGTGGEFLTKVGSPAERAVTVTASALGATGSARIQFWNVLPGGPGGPVDSLRRMRIFSSRSQLRADNSDFAVITVILTRENNNPATGDTVRFASNLGIINREAVVDSAGRAVAILRSAPVNGICRVTASAVGTNLTVSTEVLFTGIVLRLVPERTELRINEPANIEAILVDGSGNPVGGDIVNLAILEGPGLFANGSKADTVRLDPNGKARVRVNSASTGSVLVRGSALNTSDSARVVFSNNVLSLAVSKPSLLVGGRDSTLVTATLVDGSNRPVAGSWVVFAANAGTITRDSVRTGTDGKATTYLRSADFAGTATVQAMGSGGVAQAQVQFRSAAPKNVRLSVSADNIRINGGFATLQATVTDENGNMVSGENVNFRILRGPGGGEAISPPVSQTQAGVAVSRITAGSLPSSYRGTLVEASVGSIADTSKLTISGTPHIISVSRPEDDTIRVPRGGLVDESTFEFNIGAVVQDVNGNYVADGTEVHFSAVVTGMAVGRRIFVEWSGLGTANESVKAVYRVVNTDLPFEDINNNFRYDPGIDPDLDSDLSVLRRGEDRNGDGRFDWNPQQYDFWFDFNRNGVCDTGAGLGERDSVLVDGKWIFADLNNNGVWDRKELLVDVNGNGQCDLPPSGDFPYARWEVRDFLTPLTFRDNDFAVAIEASAVTRNGVASARIRYPRQFARRLYVTVNAEANGIRDRDGERFIIPQIVEQ